MHGQIHDQYLDELDGYGRLIACDEWVDGGSRQYWEVTEEPAEAGCCGEETQASSIHVGRCLSGPFASTPSVVWRGSESLLIDSSASRGHEGVVASAPSR